MADFDIKYKIKTATAEQIRSHLKECNNNFIPPLEEKVNIQEYSEKIFEKAVTFEAWAGNILAGLIAAYFNDKENLIGFITSVSLVKDYTGAGIASELLRRCVSYAKEYKFNEIRLEVNKDNSPAINLYKKFGFVDFENKDELVSMRLKLENYGG